MAINTRLEKISNSYWRPLLNRGRAIVPADGWYEWTGEKGSKQPWHIRRAIVPADGWYEWTGEKGSKQPWHIRRNDKQPLYLAALANVAPSNEHKASNGFTIVTADAEGEECSMFIIGALLSCQLKTLQSGLIQDFQPNRPK